MTNQLPTYHGSPEDEARLYLRQESEETPAAVPTARQIAPPRPDASNMQLNDEAWVQQQKTEIEHRSFLNRLFSVFTGGRTDDMESELDRAIERYPEAASNFVLRGELLLRRGEHKLAHADFLHAYEMASEKLADQHFGFVAQMTQDRALDGLERTKSALNEAD